MPNLPQPPREKETIDVRELNRWFTDIWKTLSNVVGLSWVQIDKTGSKLTDIITRLHSDLQGIVTWNGANSDKHITTADGTRWEAHVQDGSTTSHVASHIVNTPVGHISATDVQSAINQIDAALSNTAGKAWQMGVYTGGTATADGNYITITINGVNYKIGTVI